MFRPEITEQSLYTTIKVKTIKMGPYIFRTVFMSLQNHTIKSFWLKLAVIDLYLLFAGFVLQVFTVGKFNITFFFIEVYKIKYTV